MPDERRPCDVVVIGASAGGVGALERIVDALPADFPSAVLVVLHVAPSTPSFLPNILGRAGVLPALRPTDGMPLRGGVVMIAPPDHHMEIDDSVVRVHRGPRENGHPPAVDTAVPVGGGMVWRAARVARSDIDGAYEDWSRTALDDRPRRVLVTVLARFLAQFLQRGADRGA